MRRGVMATAAAALACGLVSGCTADEVPVDPTPDDAVPCEPRLADVVVGEPQVSERQRVIAVADLITDGSGQHLTEKSLVPGSGEPEFAVDPQLDELREWLFVKVSAVVAGDANFAFASLPESPADGWALDATPLSEIGEYRLYSFARDATVPFDVTCADVTGSGALTGFSHYVEGIIDCALEDDGQGGEATREVWATCPAPERADDDGA